MMGRNMCDCPVEGGERGEEVLLGNEVVGQETQDRKLLTTGQKEQ